MKNIAEFHNLYGIKIGIKIILISLNVVIVGDRLV